MILSEPCLGFDRLGCVSYQQQHANLEVTQFRVLSLSIGCAAVSVRTSLRLLLKVILHRNKDIIKELEQDILPLMLADEVDRKEAAKDNAGKLLLSIANARQGKEDEEEEVSNEGDEEDTSSVVTITTSTELQDPFIDADMENPEDQMCHSIHFDDSDPSSLWHWASARR